MRSNSPVAVLVALLMTLSPAVTPMVLGTIDGTGQAWSDGDSIDATGSRAGPLVEVDFDFSVTNPSDHSRGPEVVWVDVPVPFGVMDDHDQFSLFDQDASTEIAAGCFAADVETYPGGSVHRMRVHFKDTWGPGQTISYRAILGRYPTVGSAMSVTPSGEFVIVRDGGVEYQVHIDDSVYSENKGLYYVYLVNSPSRQVRAHGTVLTRVGGNQLDPDQASFQMYWGWHSSLEYESTPVLCRIWLTYEDPEIIHWGPAGASVQSILRDVDFVSAEVELTLYKGIHRVDVHSRRVVNERFWNHNGFVMEFTAILGNGVDWEGEYETVYGTSARHVMTSTTQGPTWTRVTPTWQDIDGGADAAPVLGDLDGDGDLDMVLGSEGLGLSVWENEGSRTDALMVHNLSWAQGLPVMTRPMPTLGDLDGDGDLDILVGNIDGTLKVYRNDGGPGGPPTWSRWWGNFDRLGLGANTAPCFGDADGDGDLDILVGLATGKIKGIINTGTTSDPTWAMDDRWVSHLNVGLTRSPAELHSAPCLVDLDYDQDLDLLLGSDDGKVTPFINMGDAYNPKWTRLDVALFAGITSGTIVAANSSLAMADVDGDGDRDLLLGNQFGAVQFHRFDGNTTPYKGHNNLQPLYNGSYRMMRDKDGNDGPFVVEAYAEEFYGYYVLANPRNGYAALRYIPDFDRLAYKQEYWGDAFPAAGGNVSYYPYDRVATENVTRAQITSNTFSNGVSGGTFISQTGTSAGFVMQPMTAMVYDSREVLLLDLQRRTDPADYDIHAEDLRDPLIVDQPLDLSIASLATDPQYPGDGEPTEVIVDVINHGRDEVRGVVVRVDTTDDLGAPTQGEDGLLIGPLDIPARGTVTFRADLDTWRLVGTSKLTASVDPDDDIDEVDELDNNATLYISVVRESLPWSDPLPVSTSRFASLHADAIVRRDGNLYTVWETCRGREEIDIEGRSYDPATDTFGSVERLVTDSHYAVEPDLALMGDAMYLAYSSNINALNNYLSTRHAKYYWGEKFDLWVRKWDTHAWNTPVQVTRAVDYDDSDQAPDIVYGANALRIFFRNTHFQFYTNGNQMDNIPYQELDVREASWRQAGGWTSGNTTMATTSGSQAWWGGPSAAAERDDLVWVVYSTEVGNQQWELKADAQGTSGLIGQVSLSNTGAYDEVRPSVASAGKDPTLMVAYEKVRASLDASSGETRDIAVRWRNSNPDPLRGWSNEMLLTTHAANDMKPTVAYDGQGNYWVAWESYRTGNKDIFISRFDGTDWFGPYQVTSHPGSDEEPVLTCDDQTGHVYLVWETDRNGMGNKDIYMRHMKPNKPILTLDAPGTGREDKAVTVTGHVVDPDEDLHHVAWDWGDGMYSSTKDTEGEHGYQSAGNYTVIATAVDRFGLESAPVQVIVQVENVPPVAIVTGDVDSVEDIEARFSALGSHDTPSDNSTLTVEWDLGDGTSLGPLPLADGMNQTHVFTASGIYNVTVTIMDDNGALANATMQVEVYNVPPRATAYAVTETLDEDEVGTFDGWADDTPSDTARGLSYVWVWGDGTTSETLTGPSATHSYSEAGDYTAVLHVIDDDGDEATATVNLTVKNLPPSLEVTGSGNLEEDEEVTLQAVGEDTTHDTELLEYLWDWGDGTVTDWSRSANATHHYVDSGYFDVRVTVRDDDGETDDILFSVSVTNVAPEAAASADVTTVPEGGTVHFSANGTWDTPSDLDGLTYTWDVGTDLIEGFEIDHAFTRSGLHTVVLTVKDDDGKASSRTIDVLVINRPPVARGWMSSAEVQVGEPISLDGTNSTDDQWDQGGLRYKWLMGDGTELPSAKGLHMYQMPGSYPVVLQVTDSDGDAGRWTTNVTVLPQKEDDTSEVGGSGLLVAGIIIILVIVLVVVLMMLRSRGMLGGRGPRPAGTAREEEGVEVEVELPPDDATETTDADVQEGGEPAVEEEGEGEPGKPPDEDEVPVQ